MQRPVRWGSYRLSYAWSKAIDDVGEFFFSAPGNNFNLREDRGRSDDDQRHRVSLDATAHTSMEPATDVWGKISHGFLLGGILQYYSALPLNVVTGGNTIQTTSQRPCAPGYVLTAGAANTCANALPGTMIGRNTGTGFDSFNLNMRLSRTFSIADRFQLEGIAEAFNALTIATISSRTVRLGRALILRCRVRVLNNLLQWEMRVACSLELGSTFELRDKRPVVGGN